MQGTLKKLKFDDWLLSLDVAPYPSMFWDIPKFIRNSYIQKWLRDVKKLDVSLHLNQFGYGYMYAINDITQCKNIIELKGGPNSNWTYEEALDEGVCEAIKLI
jgi:hypothetical protein